MKLIRTLFRILVGLVFIFSGFVKGIDPLGTVYRMNDYFLAFNTPWFSQFSLYLTIFLCVLEFTLGISLLFNLWLKRTTWILLPMMTFFTILTFFDAFYNMVPDCGCFGDAVKLSNMNTFIKNLVLMGLVIPIFIWRNRYRSPMPVRLDMIVILLFAGGFTWLSVWSYRHLPPIDFMHWKVGNTINKTEAAPVVFYVTYKNKHTGEEKEYIAPNYPWNDSIWLSQWIFQSQRVVDPNRDLGLVLRVEDETGGDYTASVIDNPDYQFIFVAYDLEKTNRDAFVRILPLYKKVTMDGFSFLCLTSSAPETVKKFRLEQGTAFDYYYSDDVVLKTMVRSNPGLIVLRDGVVKAKWAYRDLPTTEELYTLFPDLKP